MLQTDNLYFVSTLNAKRALDEIRYPPARGKAKSIVHRCFDQHADGNLKKPAELSPMTSQNGQNSAFTCPFCGAPYQSVIPSGKIQVKCRYCGAMVRVPPRFGGAFRQCPNHADSVSVGLCNNCGQSFCDRCLYVVEGRGARLFVCPQCYENRRRLGIIGFGVMAAFPLILTIINLLGLMNPKSVGATTGAFATYALMFFLMFLVVLGAGFWYSEKKPVSIHDARARFN